MRGRYRAERVADLSVAIAPSYANKGLVVLDVNSERKTVTVHQPVASGTMTEEWSIVDVSPVRGARLHDGTVGAPASIGAATSCAIYGEKAELSLTSVTIGGATLDASAYGDRRAVLIRRSAGMIELGHTVEGSRTLSQDRCSPGVPAAGGACTVPELVCWYPEVPGCTWTCRAGRWLERYCRDAAP
ncbi:MAG: hypothetical protein HYV09_32230 [Deltaproteobacteria bacterium]|nr:hypothetical protein [Deltaproteobacteria bacterium]